MRATERGYTYRATEHMMRRNGATERGKEPQWEEKEPQSEEKEPQSEEKEPQSEEWEPQG